MYSEKYHNISLHFYHHADGLNLNGSISVENNARLGGPGSNKTDVINGYAFIPDPKDPAKILVNFPSVPGPAGECKYDDHAEDHERPVQRKF